MALKGLDVAVTTMVPGAAPAVTLVCTRPCESVTALAGLRVALPDTEKFTVSPRYRIIVDIADGEDHGIGERLPDDDGLSTSAHQGDHGSGDLGSEVEDDGLRPGPESWTRTGPAVEPRVTRADTFPRCPIGLDRRERGGSLVMAQIKPLAADG